MTFAATRPRRSVLYMPGSNARALEKARTLAADCLIFDLEDAVAPEAKEAARELVVAAVRKGGYGSREIVVRVNGLDTDWAIDDLRAAATCGADAVLLPKVENGNSIVGAARVMDIAGGPKDLPIWIMAETPRGVLDLDVITGANSRVSTIVMGTSDLARDMRISAGDDRIGLLPALSHCVLTARAHGMDIIDGAHLKLDDTSGLRAACQQGRALGFDGKSLIHPRQIDLANEIFGVTAEDVAAAKEIVSAWKAARASNQGITVVQGKLVEQLHVDDAERIIALYEATSARAADGAIDTEIARR